MNCNFTLRLNIESVPHTVIELGRAICSVNVGIKKGDGQVKAKVQHKIIK
jgi:hypothetical protein